MAKQFLFSVTTPLGERVVLTRNRWREIVRFKHPALAGQVPAVRRCLTAPELVRTSVKDESFHLYYVKVDQGYLCPVVGGTEPTERFVITVYLTHEVKKGTELWKK